MSILGSGRRIPETKPAAAPAHTKTAGERGEGRLLTGSRQKAYVDAASATRTSLGQLPSNARPVSAKPTTPARITRLQSKSVGRRVATRDSVSEGKRLSDYRALKSGKIFAVVRADAGMLRAQVSGLDLMKRFVHPVLSAKAVDQFLIGARQPEVRPTRLPIGPLS